MQVFKRGKRKRKEQASPYGYMQSDGEPRYSGDGHKGLGLDEIDRLFGGGFMPSAAKELVHPGKDPVELLMRSVLANRNEARDLAITLAKCNEFGMTREKDLLLYLLAALTSISGRSRLEYLQGITGVVVPGLMAGLKEKFKDEATK